MMYTYVCSPKLDSTSLLYQWSRKFCVGRGGGTSASTRAHHTPLPCHAPVAVGRPRGPRPGPDWRGSPRLGCIEGLLESLVLRGRVAHLHGLAVRPHLHAQEGVLQGPDDLVDVGDVVVLGTPEVPQQDGRDLLQPALPLVRPQRPAHPALRVPVRDLAA